MLSCGITEWEDPGTATAKFDGESAAFVFDILGGSMGTLDCGTPFDLLGVCFGDGRGGVAKCCADLAVGISTTIVEFWRAASLFTKLFCDGLEGVFGVACFGRFERFVMGGREVGLLGGGCTNGTSEEL